VVATVVGLSALIAAAPAVATALTLTDAAYLSYLAYRVVTGGENRARARVKRSSSISSAPAPRHRLLARRRTRRPPGG
jgi:threonine/homoserine/homoserine lactone efflux protein